MGVDGDNPEDTDNAEMLPDEAAVLPERGEALGDADDDQLLTTEDTAERLGIDLD
ncbi:hypothetical protein JT689_01610 (plasmid) [Halobacterium sp. GSL-19]|uniref:hypothetical protein n=1 Tax=Halobacterium sp. GSL-19 TaxID=2812551 RepID=UPI001964660C|nr:hypothetical protein [Halobacterium sp. GSL-19]QRY21730.1 hypothetical protein JT689_01610 [Halobacterium sp. GSL-19]